MKSKTELINFSQPVWNLDVKSLTAEIADGIRDASDPLETYAHLHKLNKAIAKALDADSVKGVILPLVTGPVIIADMKVSKQMTGIRYDYTSCGHSLYNDVIVAIKLLTGLKKEIEEELSLVNEPKKLVITKNLTFEVTDLKKPRVVTVEPAEQSTGSESIVIR